MTDERAAIEALARCRFMPGIFAKRFSRDLAQKPEDWHLTPRQRHCLHQHVQKFRRQLPAPVLAWTTAYFALPDEQRGFEDAIDSAPDDPALPLVYADWLDDHGHADLAAAYRWIVKERAFPELHSCGISARPNNPGSLMVPNNYEWTFGSSVWNQWLADGRHWSPYWFSSRQKAMRWLAEVLAAEGKTAAR